MIEEAREEVVHLKQQNLQPKEKLLKVTSPVQRLEDDVTFDFFVTQIIAENFTHNFLSE